MYLIPSWWQETMDPKALLLTGLRENDFLGVSPTWHLSWMAFFLIRRIFTLWYDIAYPQDLLTRVHSKRRYIEATMRLTKAYLLFDSISINISLRMGIMNAVKTVFVTIWVWIWHGNWLVKGWWNGSMAMINEIWMNSQSASPATLVALK